MSKKTKSFRESKPRKPRQFARTKKRDEKCSTLENIVLSLLHASSAPLSFSKLRESFPKNSYGHEDIETALESLIHLGLVTKDGKNNFKLYKNALFYEGTLTSHPKGFGFVNVTKSPSNSLPLKRDPFISPGQMGGAHHGDTILVRVFNVRRDDRPEASVVKILSQGTNKIGGIFIKKGREQLVYPDDRRFPFTIRISNEGDLQPKHGDGVIAAV